MDFKRPLAVCLSVLLLAGCGRQLVQSPVVLETYAANTKLAEAASTTSNSLTELGAMQRAAHPNLVNRDLVSPNNPNMSTLASVDWSGPVGPIVKKIALASGYRLRVFGPSPAIPVLIAINEKDMPLGYILRNIDYQCGNRANIKVFPALRTIELRYARS